MVSKIFRLEESVNNKDDTCVQHAPRESAILRRLPWICAIINAAISLPLAVIEVACTVKSSPSGTYDMCILLVGLIDFPASMIVAGLVNLFSEYCKTFDDSQIAGSLVYSGLLLFTGFAWYYLIGRALQKSIRSLRGRRDARRRGFDVILPTKTPNIGTGTTGGAANGTGTGNEPRSKAVRERFFGQPDGKS